MAALLVTALLLLVSLPSSLDGSLERGTELGLDKLFHLVLFGALAALWHRSFQFLLGADGSWRFLPLLVAALGAAGYGVLLELLQGALANRDRQLGDAIADCVGPLLYVGLAVWVRLRALRSL